MSLICRAFLLILIFPVYGYSQIGGTSSFEFAELPVNARITALGGDIVSLRDGDPNLYTKNPASFNEGMYRVLGLNYMDFFADVYSFSAVYATKFKSVPVGVNFQYFGVGEMQETDATGLVVGNTSAGEYQLSLTTAEKIGNYSLGVSAKFLGSNIAGFNAHAMAVDIGGMFIHPERDWQIGMVIRNAGFMIDQYSEVSEATLPFDVLVGTSYKLENMPLRFNITAHHLHQWDITYLDTARTKQVDLEGNVEYQEKNFADMLARHFIVGGEFELGDNILLWASYNYLRRQELKLTGKSGGAGFAFGASIKVHAFSLSYSRSYYHIAGGTNNISVTTDFNRLLKRK